MACKTGTCGSGGCANSGSCSSCGTMNVYDWLSDMQQPEKPYNIVEVKFKSGRKEYYKNEDNLSITTGDAVIVETSPGHHLGYVSLQGELVRLQVKKKKIKVDKGLKKIYRHAGDKDFEKFETARNREMTSLFRTREIIRELKINMKMSDVEFQADNTKATFYYSAEERVDFRELIKLLASEFKIRVEMRQISLRQEAGRLGGIGSCGRELCCSTWISDFKSVSTSAARYQNLSLNPSKLSGQCGRLKCCLNYELDTYMDALQDIPRIDKSISTENGEAYLMKTDIFKRIMWFGYNNENTWYPLKVDRVKEIIEMNKKGEKPFTLDEDIEKIDIVAKAINSDLDRMDSKFSKGNGNKKRKKKKNPNQNKGQHKKNNPQNKGGQAANRNQSNSKNKGQQQDSNNRKKQNQSPKNKGQESNNNKQTPKNKGGQKPKSHHKKRSNHPGKNEPRQNNNQK